MYLGRSLRQCRSARRSIRPCLSESSRAQPCMRTGTASGNSKNAGRPSAAAGGRGRPTMPHVGQAAGTKSGRLQPNAVHHVRLIFQPGSECRRKLSARCRVRESVLGSFAGLGHARTRGRKPATAAGVAGGSRQRRCFQAPRAACQRVDQQARACPA